MTQDQLQRRSAFIAEARSGGIDVRAEGTGSGRHGASLHACIGNARPSVKLRGASRHVRGASIQTQSSWSDAVFALSPLARFARRKRLTPRMVPVVEAGRTDRLVEAFIRDPCWHRYGHPASQAKSGLNRSCRIGPEPALLHGPMDASDSTTRPRSCARHRAVSIAVERDDNRRQRGPRARGRACDSRPMGRRDLAGRSRRVGRLCASRFAYARRLRATGGSFDNNLSRNLTCSPAM